MDNISISSCQFLVASSLNFSKASGGFNVINPSIDVDLSYIQMTRILLNCSNTENSYILITINNKIYILTDPSNYHYSPLKQLIFKKDTNEIIIKSVQVSRFSHAIYTCFWTIWSKIKTLLPNYVSTVVAIKWFFWLTLL